ncbi:MAG TPA: adenylate/guanylate cyclase domain-containing protein [Anaerolineales bacterium]|nr:adenylate/guanylate cyclase domain-containing protein [Anaerolineales bacterium]
MSAVHEPGHLLVVDDNRVNRLLLTHGLEQQGHRVSYAENGRQALDMLNSRPFDLVLLDIEMPELNGFQVLEALLANPLLRDIPVIMTSSSDELDRVVKCIEMGAEDFLTKPLNPVLLRARVNASLEKKRLRDQQRKLLHTFATPEVADELMKSGFTLGGKHVQATAMFADIRSFTSIAESQTPADTIELLNSYFALMFDAITVHGGTLNQMVGDGLMAVFGAPIAHDAHRERAVRAALEMVENLSVFNLQQGALNKVQVKIGIGIASGEMIAGYTGTQHRATYTCVGDTVNLAARIEAHTKVAGCPILVDENTRNGLPDTILVEGLGPVLFKGKQQSVNIFSVTV